MHFYFHHIGCGQRFEQLILFSDNVMRLIIIAIPRGQEQPITNTDYNCYTLTPSLTGCSLALPVSLHLSEVAVSFCIRFTLHFINPFLYCDYDNFSITTGNNWFSDWLFCGFGLELSLLSHLKVWKFERLLWNVHCQKGHIQSMVIRWDKHIKVFFLPSFHNAHEHIYAACS